MSQGDTRWVAVFDSHGDMIDPAALSVFRQFVKFWKPTLRIHGGDAFDLRPFRSGASDEEKAEAMHADVEQGLDFLKWYKPDAITLGNHDWRLWRCAAGNRDAARQMLAAQLIDRIKDTLPDTKMLPYDKRAGVFRAGRLKIIHGYHSGMYAAKQAALIWGSVLMGHTHAIDEHSIAGLDRRVGRICGCLCRLDMDYNRAQPNTLRQAHGWAYGILRRDGSYVVWQAEQIDGRWLFASETREVRHAA